MKAGRDRLGDEFAKQATIALPEPVHGDLHRALAQIQPAGEFNVGHCAAFPHQREPQSLEQRAFPIAFVFLTQPLVHFFKQCEGPTSVIHRFGGGGTRQVACAGGFGHGAVQTDHPTASAFLGPRFVPFIGEKMIHGSQQIGAESASLGTHTCDIIAFQQAGEERLRQVLGIVRRVAPTPHIGVERAPIGLAQFGQRIVSACGILPTRRQDHGPMGGDEGRVPGHSVIRRTCSARAGLGGGAHHRREPTPAHQDRKLTTRSPSRLFGLERSIADRTDGVTPVRVPA